MVVADFHAPLHSDARLKLKHPTLFGDGYTTGGSPHKKPIPISGPADGDEVGTGAKARARQAAVQAVVAHQQRVDAAEARRKRRAEGTVHADLPPWCRVAVLLAKLGAESEAATDARLFNRSLEVCTMSCK